jgi:hypothetical protein
MTSTTTHTDQSRTSARLVPAALGTVAAAIALDALGTFGDGSGGSEHGASEFLAIAGVIVVASAIVFGLVVPRLADSKRAGGVGLGLSIAGLVLVLVFWSGLPPVLAVGGILLGTAARSRGRGGAATAAIAVGVLALVGDVAIYVADWMSTNNILGM